MNVSSQISKTEALSSQVSPQAQACIEWLRSYAGRKINSRLIDERRCIPPYIVLDFGNQGLLGMEIPVALGGKLELSCFDSLKVIRQISAIDITLASFLGVNNILGIRPILNYATPNIRQRMLPDLAAGRVLAAFAYTEPGAGSNPLGITSTARRTERGEFVLNGTKVWSGTAAWSGMVNVFANQISADGKSQGYAAFCVPTDLKGVRQGPEALTTGLRGMVQNSIFFDDVQIGAEFMLGQAGGGLTVANDVMLRARLWVAASAVGGIRRALQLAGRYARRRAIGAENLIDSDLVRSRLASMHAAACALDGLVDQMARDIDDDVVVLPAEMYAVAKAVGGEWLNEAVDAAIQTLGGRGYIETNHLAQMMRDARIARIFEGPTDTMLLYVGKRALESNVLLDYMEQHLRAAETVASLRNHLAQVSTNLQAMPDQHQNIGYAIAGELTALHLVHACNQGKDAEICLSWLDRRIALVAAGAVRPVLRSRTDIEKILFETDEAIGDIEQAAPDEERSMDPYLRRDFA